jgi:hypothetical protein
MLRRQKTITEYSGKKVTNQIMFKMSKEKDLIEEKEVDAAPTM